MTYLKRTNVTQKKGRAATAAILFALAILFVVHVLFPKAYSTILYPISSVFWKSESGALSWIFSMGEIASSKYSLVKENARLSGEIESRDTSMLLLDTLRTENEDLKRALSRSGAGDDILGIVLTRPPVSPYDTIVVDVGSDDGVREGNKVYTEGDILIGDVAEVYKDQSKISLYSTPGRMVPIIIGDTGVEIQATGRGGGNFFAKLPAEVPVEKGDLIITPQIRPHSFGTAEEIIVDSSDSMKTVLFKTPININQFRFVEIDRSSSN